MKCLPTHAKAYPVLGGESVFNESQKQGVVHPVELISDHRVSHAAQSGPNLVQAAGFGAGFDQAEGTLTIQKPEKGPAGLGLIRDRRFRIRRNEPPFLAHRAVGIRDEKSVGDHRFGREVPFHQDLVHLPDGSGFKLGLADAGGLRIFGNQHKSRGLPIQAVDEMDFLQPLSCLEQSPEGMGEVAAARVAGEIAGLVDHQDGVIPVHDFIVLSDGRFYILRWLIGEGVTWRENAFGRKGLFIKSNVTRFDIFLPLGSVLIAEALGQEV